MQQGTDDSSHGLFTTFAPRHNSPGFAVITEKTRIMTHTWSTNPVTPSATGGYRILHIFWDKDDQTLLALGTEQTKSSVHLLAIANIAKRGDPKFQRLATFPDLRQESITSSMIATSIYSSAAQDFVLVTSIDAGTVRLFRVPLISVVDSFQSSSRDVSGKLPLLKTEPRPTVDVNVRNAQDNPPSVISKPIMSTVKVDAPQVLLQKDDSNPVEEVTQENATPAIAEKIDSSPRQVNTLLRSPSILLPPTLPLLVERLLRYLPLPSFELPVTKGKKRVHWTSVS
jgi:hypothetical protein